ncbi:UNVERIFIED_CONTAM: hypothetical protein NCL1_13214 [Trichonephila clavipes]
MFTNKGLLSRKPGVNEYLHMLPKAHWKRTIGKLAPSNRRVTIYGSTGSMMSILAGMANSFKEEIAFSVDCEDCHFCSEKIFNVKRFIIDLLTTD